MGVEQIKNYNKKPAIDILIINCNKQILCGFYSFFSNVSKKININIIDSRCMEVYGQIKSEIPLTLFGSSGISFLTLEMGSS